MTAPRIDVQQAHHEVDDTNALLVCAYDSKDKFEDNRLEGAISLDRLQSEEENLSKDRELIFYCA